MAASIQEAGIPRAGSNVRDEPDTLLGRGATTTASNACVFPPICLAVGSIAVPSELPYLFLPRGRGAAAPNDDDPQSVELHDGEVGDEGDEPRPGYAFVDSDDDENCDEAQVGGGWMDRFEFDVDCTFVAQRDDRGHGLGEDDNNDNASHRTGSSGESDGTDASGSTHDDDDDGNNTPVGGMTTTSPNTHQLLVELMVRMRESRELAQQLQDHQMMSERMSQSSAPPVGTQPAPAPRTIPASHALQPRCPSRLGRSATARLYPNVVATLGSDMSRDRTNQPRCVGLLKADTLTDSEDDEDDDDEVDELCGRGTRCRFEIWRVHASHDVANDGELCFQMWKARADWRSRQVQRNKEQYLEGRMIGHGTRLLDPSLCADHEDDLKNCAGSPPSVRSDARRVTPQVPVVCDWIRKLRNDSSDRRIMILSTAEDAAARSHPSYHVVSNLILNPDGSQSEAAHLLASKSEAAPIEPVPTSSSSNAMRKLWPASKSGLKTADALAGKRGLAAGAPPHVGLSTASLERSQQLALDRLRCWKRRRPGCVVGASTDASSSATVASF
jgi:hypothetical protein